jgi:hypothetical protein
VAHSAGGSDPDKHARSALQCVADILSPQASIVAIPRPQTNTVPGHIANILNVILLHDKFDQNFDKWNLLVMDDRDTLVLTLKSGAQVDSSLVYTICMMYPFRIHGPLVIKNTMHVEFLHENRLEVQAVTSDRTPKNIEYMLGTCQHTTKRRRLQHLKTHHQETLPARGVAVAAVSTVTSTADSTATPSASIAAIGSKLPSTNTETASTGSGAGTAPPAAPVSSSATTNRLEPASNHTLHFDLDLVRQKLTASLQSTNNSRVFVDHFTTGFDVGGSWVTFQLSDCDKLNLDFMGSFQLSVDDLPIKVCLHPYLYAQTHNMPCLAVPPPVFSAALLTSSIVCCC